MHLSQIAAEISALVGDDRTGTLEMVDSLDPNLRTRLVPIANARTKHDDLLRLVSSSPEPLRWLHDPISFFPTEETKSFLLARMAYVEWWRNKPLGSSSDYFARWDARGEIACVMDALVMGWMG
jgi:hypothetical protein